MTAAPGSSTRVDSAILLAVTAYALVFLARGAAVWELSIDESWHVFFAHLEPVTRAVLEWGSDSHPPLTYILLRPIVRIADDPFWARMASVVPALFQPWLLFAILRRLDVARPAAHAAVIVFTTSHAFAMMGVCIRSYSIATTFGLAAALAALRLLPGSGAPDRRQLVLLLASLALGTASLYAAGLAAGAVGLTLAVLCVGDRRYGKELIATVRRVSRKPEWIAFGACIAVTVAFYVVTYLGREMFHLDPWMLEEGQGPVDFAVRGATHDLALFTPIDVADGPAAAIVAALLLVFLVVSTVLTARRGRGPRGLPRAVVLGSVVTLSATFWALGLLRIYPFGGELRHQYPLFPLGVIALFTLVDDAYRALPNRASRALLLGSLLALGAWTTVRSFATTQPEFPPDAVWAPEAAAALEADDGVPVCLPKAVFIAWYGRYLHLDWRYVESEDGWETYETRQPTRRVYRHRPTWSLEPVPAPEFLVALRGLCETSGERVVRVCTPRPGKPLPRPVREALEDEVRERCAVYGFRLVERRVLPSGEIYTLAFEP